jgi:hypothetical protein
LIKFFCDFKLALFEFSLISNLESNNQVFPDLYGNCMLLEWLRFDKGFVPEPVNVNHMVIVKGILRNRVHYVSSNKEEK